MTESLQEALSKGHSSENKEKHKQGDSFHEDNHQQQILFDELENKKSHTDELSNQALVFDNQAWQAIDEKSDSESAPFDNSSIDDDKDNKQPSWIWRTIAILVGTLITIELVEFFSFGFSHSPILASIYALLLACLTFVSGSALIKEFSGLRQLKQQKNVQTQAYAILSEQQDNSARNAKNLCQQITKQLPCDLLSEQEKNLAAAMSADYSDVELLQLYSQSVLAKVDQKVMAEIAKSSSEAMVLVALSPIALLDMLIMLSRNLRLINKISALYGLKLGYWSRIKLIKSVFINMAYAGASELIADVGAELLGADLLSKLSSRFAQGLGAGMLTARLGINAMTLCRPIPLNDKKPRLKQVSREVLTQIKQLIKTS
jgi:putative membrane protein